MKHNPHILTAACVAALVFCGPSLAFAASKKSDSPSPSPAASASPAAGAKSGSSASGEKSARAIPFRGTASTVDQSGKTFVIAGKKESRTFKVTDKSTVTRKDGSAATFADLSDNTAVTGSYWKHDDGTLEIKTLKIGEAATAGSSSSKKSDASAGGASPSPSPKK